jgi:bifunctional oligoribonuclease and PAP phosphatase NrnA
LNILELKSIMENQKLINCDLSSLQNLLFDGPKKILILTHRNPDGDAIGTSLGLYNILKKLQHEVNVLVPNQYPDFLGWMPSAREIIVYSEQKPKAVQLLKDAEILFAIDFNDLSRIREFEEYVMQGKAFRILIDHHPDPHNFANIAVSNTEASSSSELLYAFIKAINLGKYMDKDIASCIYVGIMTDTGCFSYNSSRTSTFMEVAELLEYKIEKDKIYDLIYDNYSYNRMQLMGYCLDKKMQYFPEYRAAFISLSSEELKKYNYKNGDSEGFVNLPLSIDDVRFAAIFIENKKSIKISMRSKGNFSVNKVCADHFNGGGHKNAAGGESYDDLQQTIDKFVKLLPTYKNELFKD